MVLPAQVPGAEPSTLTMAAPAAGNTPPTELRVHGVSGQPAEDMLDRPLIVRVAGDGDAGFFRPRTEYGATLGPGGARLEAYRWGNLTAGAAARALWLLLLPFTLANVMMWLRPPATGAGRRIVHGLSRIFALSISATFTLATVGVFLDLVAWQCTAPDSQCGHEQPWLEIAFSGYFEPTARRLALATLGPILFVSLLWFLAARTWARYESYRPPPRNPDGDGLATPTFWDGRDQVGRLRSVHVAFMFAIINVVLLSVLLGHDLSTEAYVGVGLYDGAMVEMIPDVAVSAGGALLAVSLGIIGASVLLVLLPAVVDRVSKSRLATFATTGLRWIALLATGLTLAYALLPRASWSTGGPLPDYGESVTTLFAAQVVVLALLVLMVGLQRHRCRGAFFGGFGAPVIGSLALGTAAALSAGVSYRVSDFLGGSGLPSPADFAKEATERQPLQPPVAYEWAAVGFVMMVVVVILTVLWITLVTKPILKRKARADTDDDYPGGRQRDPYRADRLDLAVANARLGDSSARVIAVSWFTLAAAGAVATWAAFSDKGPVELAESGSTAAEVLSIVANAGTYLISLSAVGLVFLGIQTYRNPRVRRTVGIIWDLGTFWPRASHPLGPPCYAERVVPELVHRATWLATEQGGVVLSGHSQGTVLAAAAVLQLSPEAKRRTALLTYGSPLNRLYRRAFPNYFNDGVFNEIAEAVAGPHGEERWINLWRRTDPIGGPVGIGDRRLADPSSFDPRPGDRIAPAVQAHSNYQLTPQFNQAMDDLVGLLAEPHR